LHRKAVAVKEFVRMPDPFTENQTFLLTHSQLLLRSFHHWFKRDLIPLECDPLLNARHLFEAPFALLSGGTEGDQILNYGNLTALKLWGLTWAQFTRTPSRQTAEPMHQATRAAFLQQVRDNGYVENYGGVRISSSGERFRIENAIVWNLLDDDGLYAGQAAMFPKWTPI
jgi:hypothetical protein